MEQYYSHYKNWEDFNNGMYRLSVDRDKDIYVFNAIDLLKSSDQFYNTCNVMLNEWEVSAKVNMTNKGQNRNAWLGAAACCYKHNTPEYLTRIAWSLLNKEYQDLANRVADRVILEYERKDKSVYKNMGAERLF